MSKKKVLIAMSGGVDSAVTAYLLQQQGYLCKGATMLLCGNEDTAGAKAICHMLGMEYEVYDCREPFHREVITPFVEAYEQGETPNPCILCNEKLKFGELYRIALAEGCDFLATGHYARIVEEDGRFRLKKATDPGKDQSYVLYGLTEEHLSRVLFPLGGLTKEQVRRIAEENGFANARKGDSQDICFIPDGDHAGYIRRTTGKNYPEGEFVDLRGQVMGRHRGIICYTVGQRKGLGLALPEPYYVCRKDAKTNRVVLGTAAELPVDRLWVKDFCFTGGGERNEAFRATVRTRYHQKEQPVTVVPMEGGGVLLQFDAPVSVAAPGQSAVVYEGDRVIGGGKIV